MVVKEEHYGSGTLFEFLCDVELAGGLSTTEDTESSLCEIPKFLMLSSFDYEH